MFSHLQFCEEIAVFAEFKNYVNTSVVVKVPIKSANVLVFDMRLDLYFPSHLMLQICVLDLIFEHNFQR